MTCLHLLKIQCRLFSVSQIKEDILPLKTPWEKILFPEGEMTFLQNTGICWYEKFLFIFYITKRGTRQKRDHRGTCSKVLLLKQKTILKLFTYILRQWGFILCIYFFYFCSYQRVNILKSNSDVNRLKNKAFITKCHLKYLEECSVTNKIHL